MKRSKAIVLIAIILMVILTSCNKKGDNPGSSLISSSMISEVSGNSDSSLTEESSTVSNKTSSTVSEPVSTPQSSESTSTSSNIEKPAVREYYSSAIGMWYCVWWDSEAKDSVHYTGHWIKETRSKPVKYGYYATDDTEKLKWDLNYFNQIGIDYLIIDDTNNHQADGGNIASHINTLFKTTNEIGAVGAPKLCFAGGSPLLNGNEAGMVAEMDIFNGYAKKYSDITYMWKGKPLFVDFNDPKNFKFTDARFTMRNACGHTSEAQGVISKFNLNMTGLYGWVFDYTFEGAEAYGVNPGWSRSHNGLDIGVAEKNRENGDLYRRLWLKALKAKPETIVIASWNDHAEETGIEAVNLTGNVAGREVEKANPYLYQQMTEGYLALKTGFVRDFYYKAESDSAIYQYTGSELKAVSSVPVGGVLLWIPDDYYSWSGVKKS